MPKMIASLITSGLALVAVMANALWMPACLAASVTAAADAEVLRPVAVSAIRELQFGALTTGSEGGSVTLELSGKRSAFGEVKVAPTSEGQLAQIVVTGSADACFALTLPESAVLTDGRGHRVIVSSFTNDAVGKLPNGRVEVAVGAALTLEPNQPAGFYAGTFPVTVDYH